MHSNAMRSFMSRSTYSFQRQNSEQTKKGNTAKTQKTNSKMKVRKTYKETNCAMVVTVAELN